MKTRNTFFLLGLLAFLLLVLVACGGKDNEEAQDGYPAPEATFDTASVMNSIQLQPEANGPPEQVQSQPIQQQPNTGTNVPSSTGFWCMNGNQKAAYPEGAKFHSDYLNEWLICRASQGGYEKEDGTIVPAKIVSTMPTVWYFPWDGVTYAP